MAVNFGFCRSTFTHTKQNESHREFMREIMCVYALHTHSLIFVTEHRYMCIYQKLISILLQTKWFTFVIKLSIYPDCLSWTAVQNSPLKKKIGRKKNRWAKNCRLIIFQLNWRSLKQIQQNYLWIENWNGKIQISGRDWFFFVVRFTFLAWFKINYRRFRWKSFTEIKRVELFFIDYLLRIDIIKSSFNLNKNKLLISFLCLAWYWPSQNQIMSLDSNIVTTMVMTMAIYISRFNFN